MILNRLLQLLVLLPALLFIATGLRWLVAPAGVAPQFGLGLEQGVGLSTQVGDLASFFLVLGLSMLFALVTGRRTWFYPPVLLLAIAALGRLVAWLFHDAALAMDMIMPELVIAGILLLASRRLPRRD